MSTNSIQLFKDGEPTDVTGAARNLGVYFDSKLSMDEHVLKVVNACKATLVNLWRIAGKLSRKLRTLLVCSLIHSKMDYCNSLMTGMTKKNVLELQKVQNAASRFIFGQRRWQGTTQLRKKLHFLPVTERIEFKTCVLVYKCLNGLAPEYLSGRVQRRKQKLSIKLRADEDKLLLKEPGTTFETTKRAFSISGPKLWNELPRKLRESKTLNRFKADLKTFLFCRAFGV